MDYRRLTIYQRALTLSLALIKHCQALPRNSATHIISQQLVRSSTSTAANIAEGSYACSRREFIKFLQISLKSGAETEHWLITLERLGYNSDLITESQEINRILTAIIKKAKSNHNY